MRNNLLFTILLFMPFSTTFGDEHPKLAVSMDSDDLGNVCILTTDLLTCSGSNLQVPVNGGIEVATGQIYTCVRDFDGVKCFEAGKPSYVPPLKAPRQILSAGNHACAVDAEGIKCWAHANGGDFNFGQSDTIIGFFKNPKIFGNALNTCAIDEGKIYCWGRQFPKRKILTDLHLNNPRTVGIGFDHVCALGDEGVKCLGNNQAGQLNVPALKNPKNLSSGYSANCANDDEGLKCWGSFFEGTPISHPAWHFSNLSHFTAKIGTYACALDGIELKCWGNPGNLGIQEHGPSAMEFHIRDAKLHASAGVTCASNNERTKCWGYDLTAALGYAEKYKDPLDIAFAQYFGCALMSDAVRCWGSLGGYSIPSVLSPVIGPKQISVAMGSVCVLDSQGVRCWDEYNQSYSIPLKTPTLIASYKENQAHCAVSDEGLKCWTHLTLPKYLEHIPSDIRRPTTVALGKSHACVIDEGRVKCWTEKNLPQYQPPGGIKNPRQLISGWWHSCVLDDDGVKCWGDTALLGHTSMSKIPLLKDPVQLVGGRYHACVRDAEGVKCWGQGAASTILRDWWR